ncbi:unnamed protein product [Coccothraustes coccothraustes]
MAPVCPQVSWHGRLSPRAPFGIACGGPALLRASEATGSGAISSRSIEVEGKNKEMKMRDETENKESLMPESLYAYEAFSFALFGEK